MYDNHKYWNLNLDKPHYMVVYHAETQSRKVLSWKTGDGDKDHGESRGDFGKGAERGRTVSAPPQEW